MTACIYKITNCVNNKFYIGSSKHFERRIIEHRRNFITNKSNLKLLNSVKKYGIDNFKFTIVEEIFLDDSDTEETIKYKLETREQYFVDTLNPEYNIRKIDISRNVGVCSDQQRKHLREIAKLKKNKELCRLRGLRRKGKYIGETCKTSIEVDVYKRDNLEFVETIKGLRNCDRKYKTSVKHICKNGYTKQYKNDFVFCYHGEDVSKLYRKRKQTKFIRKNTTPIKEIDEFGNVIKIWRTKGDAEKYLGLSQGSVSRVVSGEYKHTKGHIFIK